MNKYPAGAVTNEQSVFIQVKVTKDTPLSSLQLILKEDFTQKIHVLHPSLSKIEADGTLYTFEISKLDTGLYFYYFEVRSEIGMYFLSNNKFQAVPTLYFNEVNCWQLTVYDKEFHTPDWFKGGIMYQIFPDRFKKSNKYKAPIARNEEVRIKHSDWNDNPDSGITHENYKAQDFFLGNLKGIEEELEHFKKLNVNCIYLNPIMESPDNHRYSTADYFNVDPYLGTNDDFKFLDKINFFTSNRQKNINFTGKLYSLQMRFGLIGKHLSHSFSKRFFEDYFVHNGIDAHYDNIELANIADFEAVLARQEYGGFNVTNPYKIEIMDYLTALDETARNVGAVNCVKITGNDIVGYNTDVYGFTEAIKSFVRQHHRRALVLGSGGASKAVQSSLQSFGIENLVASRQTTDNTIPYSEIDRNIIDECRIIVNATPLGMFPATDSYPDIPYQYIGGRHLLFDLIYNPSETLFLKKGRQQGAKTVNGLEMLISQALRAIEIFNIRQ